MFSNSRTFISTPITFLANTTFKYASRFHLIPSAGADLEANHSQPGSARAEAERRRPVFSALSVNVDNNLILQGNGTQGTGPETRKPCEYVLACAVIPPESTGYSDEA